MLEPLLVMTNVPDAELAVTMATCLVEQGLAACVNILPPVKSVYRWQGKVEHATELSLLIKTTSVRYAELQAAIISMHPYEVPEIIAIPVTAGLPAYLNWIEAETVKVLNA